jgi:hypothetical protein
MNTLQQASKVYKAFKKGGPSFGAWQVRLHCLQVTFIQLTSRDRCFRAPIMPEQSLAPVLIGYVLTQNTETSMVHSYCLTFDSHCV